MKVPWPHLGSSRLTSRGRDDEKTTAPVSSRTSSRRGSSARPFAPGDPAAVAGIHEEQELAGQVLDQVLDLAPAQAGAPQARGIDLVGRQVVVLTLVAEPMGREEQHGHVTLRGAADQPFHPVEDGAVGRLLVGQDTGLDLVVDLPFLAFPGGRELLGVLVGEPEVELVLGVPAIPTASK